MILKDLHTLTGNGFWHLNKASRLPQRRNILKQILTYDYYSTKMLFEPTALQRTYSVDPAVDGELVKRYELPPLMPRGSIKQLSLTRT